jgi:hypothetical protein
MSIALQMRRPFKDDFGRGNRWKSLRASLREYGRCCSLVTLFFVKITLTKTNRCAGVMWRTNQPLVLQYSRRFLRTASLKPWLMSNHSKHCCKLFQQIPWTSCSYYNIFKSVYVQNVWGFLWNVCLGFKFRGIGSRIYNLAVLNLILKVKT